jgi:hypothetical protein
MLEIGCKPESKRDRDRREILDRVCEKNQLTPRQLADAPIEKAIELIRAEMPTGPIDPAMLSDHLESFANSA